MEFFQKSLEEFAKNHKDDINKDPQFRFHFHQMCLKIGVDPLACKKKKKFLKKNKKIEASKGFWAKLLGVGDFYYELSVQIIEGKKKNFQTHFNSLSLFKNKRSSNK